MDKESFEWGPEKALIDQVKHGVSFAEAQFAFADSDRVIAKDLSQSEIEQRYYCFGKVDDGVMTVRFTYRHSIFRIIGACYWHKGKNIYERENKTPMSRLAPWK